MADSILIFDSGVGGLSVLSQVRQQFPETCLHYLMDSEMFPYGTRSDEALVQRIVNVCVQGCEKYQPALIILACNTASTLALPQLRQALKIPVVGVVPAIRVAGDRCIQDSQTLFGLLATPATVRRSYTDKLISDFASHCHVERFGSKELVTIAERKISGADIKTDLNQHLSPWLAQFPTMQKVVLGCTHYPLLRDELETLWPNIEWIDSGEAVARQAARVFPADPLGDQTIHLSWTANQRPPGVRDFLALYGALGNEERLNVS